MGFLDFFRRKHAPSIDPRLLGRWVLIRTEDDIDTGEGVTAEFWPDGSLIYAIHQADRGQIMRLTYRVESDELVTDQPSAPRPERANPDYSEGMKQRGL